MTRSQTALLQVEMLTEQMGRNQKGAVSHHFHKLREQFLPLTEEGPFWQQKHLTLALKAICVGKIVHHRWRLLYFTWHILLKLFSSFHHLFVPLCFSTQTGFDLSRFHHISIYLCCFSFASVLVLIV